MKTEMPHFSYAWEKNHAVGSTVMGGEKTGNHSLLFFCQSLQLFVRISEQTYMFTLVVSGAESFEDYPIGEILSFEQREETFQHSCLSSRWTVLDTFEMRRNIQDSNRSSHRSRDRTGRRNVVPHLYPHKQLHSSLSSSCLQALSGNWSPLSWAQKAGSSRKYHSRPCKQPSISD